MVSPDSDRVARAPPYLGTTLSCFNFLYGTVTLFGHSFQSVLISPQLVMNRPTTPAGKSSEFRLFPGRSPLLWESLLISFPAGTKMFQFPAFAYVAYVFSYAYCRSSRFPDSEISGSKFIRQLPEAFRSLSRLSSPLNAKASTMCP
jgi:hypothetical protein